MVKVKICGVTTAEDALTAVEYGADALGFNFYPPSPRYIPPEKAAAILREVPPGVCTVGLFVNETRQHVTSVLRTCGSAEGAGLTAVQFHGDEDRGFCRRWPVKVIKAFRVRDRGTLGEIGEYPVDYYLLDSWSRELFGGSGSAFTWNWLGEPMARPVILAGGLYVENVSEAVRAVKPFGVDVCTGVEAVPGRKDHQRMKDFIAAAKAE